MNKIRVGVIGLNFGTYVIDNEILKGPGEPYVDLAGVCRRSKDKCDEVASKYGVKAFYDIDDMLADDGIEAVVLMTGPVGRAGQIHKMIDAGKHVMTTKPFELDSADAAGVLARARREGIVVHLNSPVAEYSDDFKKVEEWRGKYDLGRPIAARHECWYKRVEEADGGWYDDPEQCPVAPVFRLGIYGINDLVQILGRPASVQVTQSRIFTGRPTPDLAMLSIAFENGCLAETLDGWCIQPSRGSESLTLYYEGGTIFRNPAIVGGSPFNSPVRKLCVVPAENSNGRPAETLEFGHQQLSQCYQWNVFHKAVHGEPLENPVGDDPIVDGIKVIEAMKKASFSGKTESV